MTTEPEQITEALSRAVIGGIVHEWAQPEADRWLVRTADGLGHDFTTTEAGAFAEAVFATEAHLGRERARTGEPMRSEYRLVIYSATFDAAADLTRELRQMAQDRGLGLVVLAGNRKPVDD